MMKNIVLIFKILFIVALIVFVVKKFDPKIARDAIATENALWGMIALFTIGISFLFLSLRCKYIIKGFYSELKITIIRIFSFNLLAMFYTIIIPTWIAGEASRIFKFKNELNKTYKHSTIIIAFDKILGAITWFVIFMLTPLPFNKKDLWVAASILIIVLFFLRKKIIAWGEQILEFSKNHPKYLSLGLIYSLIGQIFFVIAVYFMFICFRINLTFLEITGITATAALSTSIPLTWLGIGVREGTYLGLLSLYGVSSSQAILVVTFLVFTNYVFGLIGGFIELISTGWNLSCAITNIKENAVKDNSSQ